MATFARILVPVDASEPARRALALALQLARESGGHVRVLHVADELEDLRGCACARSRAGTWPTA
ncbi:universal stress protein [Ramlibacter algicola]|uniref:universal stress protein n=1 Tax=Ramlibacter algicola TaxID=2795217 RepID=UPI0030846142